MAPRKQRPTPGTAAADDDRAAAWGDGGQHVTGTARFKVPQQAQDGTMDVDLRTLTADLVVDTRGQLCPLPVLAAGKNIGKVAVGGMLEIQATDAGAASDLPAWAKRAGHEYVGMLQKEGYLRVFVRRRA
jgi:tRNA 2-thiouridine synthesizing protein A